MENLQFANGKLTAIDERGDTIIVGLRDLIIRDRANYINGDTTVSLNSGAQTVIDGREIGQKYSAGSVSISLADLLGKLGVTLEQFTQVYADVVIEANTPAEVVE